MERRDYQIEERNAVLAQAEADGKRIIEDVTIDLDENGRLTNCYIIVVDAPPAQDPSYDELLEAYKIATGGGPS